MANAAWQAWYKTPRWKAVRLAQLRAEPWCAYCLKAGNRVAALVCDHVEPHRGNEQSFWNGPRQSLCQAHHSASKQRAERRGFGSEVGSDGWPTDEHHPANRASLPTTGGIIVLAHVLG